MTIVTLFSFKPNWNNFEYDHFIFHLVCYINKCLRVETSFWTGGCTHTPAKCQSSYMRKKCIASNLITTCRILIKKKKKKKFLYLVVWRREGLPSSFFLLYFSSLMLSFHSSIWFFVAVCLLCFTYQDL